MKKTQMKAKILIRAVVACVFVFLILSFVFPKLLGYKYFYIESESMTPTIPKGSMVFVKQIEFEKIKAGDVLTFTNENNTEYFTHRVVEVDDDNQMLTTKGDASDIQDPLPSSYYFAVGKVDFSIPLVGSIAKFISTPIGKVIVSAVYIAWIAVEIEIFVVKRKTSQEELL